MPPKKRLQADPDSSGDDITLQPPLPKRHTGADRAQNTPRDRPLNSRAISIDLTKPPPPPASPYAKNMRNDENDFQFNVLLSPKFKAFPDAVGKEVLRSYMETIKALMECLKSGETLTSPYRYSIISAQSIRPSSEFVYSITASDIHHCSIANVELLKHFLSLHGNKIRFHLSNGAPSNFVKLETQEGMTNPEFIHLHSVRYGEVGWGFDAAGCLSLYWVEMVDKKNVIGVVFVRRGVGKVEEG